MKIWSLIKFASLIGIKPEDNQEWLNNNNNNPEYDLENETYKIIRDFEIKRII